MALLIGGKIVLEGFAPWLAEAGYPVSFGGQVRVRVSDLSERRERELLYHPKTLIAGIGAERGVGVDEVIALVEESLASQVLLAMSPFNSSRPATRPSAALSCKTLPPS